MFPRTSPNNLLGTAQLSRVLVQVQCQVAQMARRVAYCLLQATVFSWLCVVGGRGERADPMGEEGGYYRREHSLVAPYTGEW